MLIKAAKAIFLKLAESFAEKFNGYKGTCSALEVACVRSAPYASTLFLVGQVETEIGAGQGRTKPSCTHIVVYPKLEEVAEKPIHELFPARFPALSRIKGPGRRLSSTDRLKANKPRPVALFLTVFDSTKN